MHCKNQRYKNEPLRKELLRTGTLAAIKSDDVCFISNCKRCWALDVSRKITHHLLPIIPGPSWCQRRTWAKVDLERPLWKLLYFIYLSAAMELITQFLQQGNSLGHASVNQVVKFQPSELLYLHKSDPGRYWENREWRSGINRRSHHLFSHLSPGDAGHEEHDNVSWKTLKGPSQFWTSL